MPEIDCTFGNFSPPEAEREEERGRKKGEKGGGRGERL